MSTNKIVTPVDRPPRRRTSFSDELRGQGMDLGERNVKRPIAIGLVRAEVSGLRVQRHTEQIRHHAERLGYVYAYTVRPPADDVDPVGYALGLAAGLGVDAMIVYDLETVGHSPSRVCQWFDLETVSPPATWAASVLSPADAVHAHPEQPLSVASAHRIMQQHLECHAVECARKSSAYSFLVRAGKIAPPIDTPRERAAARGIAFRPRPDSDVPLPDGVDLKTLLDVLVGLAEYPPSGNR
ncbi:hypothetical protein FHY52_04480 [Nocardia nova]|uniref:hypothetical protein n=1 Tax=Nocardia nova TaxID=37330 RepID=UPI0025AF8E54|nr:hypothetical protein [Nocardia nova]MDN2495955.1 hypothetical protein [Nocardia nova]